MKRIEDERIAAKGGCRFLDTAKASINARAKFFKGEWLGKVVVCAGVKPGDSRIDRTKNAQDDDWRSDILLVRLADEIKTIHLR